MARRSGVRLRVRSRELRGRAVWLFLALLASAALPAACAEQLRVEVGPRGEITGLSVGSTPFLSSVTLSIPSPGWSSTLADQAGVPVDRVRRTGSAASTTLSYPMQAGEARIEVVATVARGEGRVSVDYTLTADRDVPVETVLLTCAFSVDTHAGKTRYLVCDAGCLRGLCPPTLPTDSYVLFHSGSADWVGFIHPDGAALRIRPRGLALQFQDNRKWDVPTFSLLATTSHGKLSARKAVRFGLTFEAVEPGALESEAEKAMRSDIAGMPIGDDRSLAVRSAVLNRKRVPVYDSVEVVLDIAATYANAFDPREINVEAAVSGPNGLSARVPGFFHAPMRLERGEGGERLRLSGKPGFRIRYTPPQPGRYSMTVTASDRSGSARSAALVFVATPSSDPGFVRVAPTSRRYFAFDSGKPFIAVGENVCWAGPREPMADYAAWLGALGAAGGNWARLWLAFNEKGLEWMPAPTPRAGIGSYGGLGRYALDNAWRLDEVVRIARQSGVRLMFCIGTYGEFTEGGYFGEGAWVSNPYNAANGGPCAKPEDFWTNAEARRLYQQRLRYLVARWGHAPTVFAWEFWNEVPPTPAQEKWVAEMAAYLKRIDPNKRLVSTTYGSPAVWRCSDVDFTMTHMYGQAGNTADFTPQIAAHARDHRQYDKPYILAEFGIDWQTGDERWDPKGVGTGMHNGAWAGLLSGGAGTAMLWYWDGYVHPKGMYRILTPVRAFVDRVDWTSAPLAPIEGIRLSPAPGTPETFSDIEIPSMIEWGMPPSTTYTVLRDGSVRGGPIAMAIGSPERSTPAELPSQLSWELDMPSAGKVVVRLGQVCTRAHMVLKLDGKAVVDRVLTAGEPGKGPWKSSRRLEQYGVWVSDYDDDIALEVPAGKHVLTAENRGGDWYQIRSVRLPAYRSDRYPDVNALGLARADLLLMWLHNRASTWKTDYEGKAPAPQKGLGIEVPVGNAAAWHVEWFDTWVGKVVKTERARRTGGVLKLVAPDFARDIAVIARPVR